MVHAYDMMYFDLLVLREYHGVGHSHFVIGWKTAEKSAIGKLADASWQAIILLGQGWEI